MPANLTPDYMDAEQRFRKASSTAEKLEALEEMLATIPKHKGTEKMQADIKRRMAKLRDESKRGSGASRKGSTPGVEREGAAQVTLLGPPNSGKSLLLTRLTKAHADVADYPFTTRRPTPGMMEIGNVQVQLVDLPPIAALNFEPWVAGISRTADASLLVLDLADPDALEHVEQVCELMKKSKVHLYGRAAPREIPYGAVSHHVMIVGTRLDLPAAADNLEVLRDLLSADFEIAAVSSVDGQGLEDLRQHVFRFLALVRVYTKAPGKPPDRSRPYVVREGATVLEVAHLIHKDFAQRLKFARIWGSDKYDGQPVQRDHVLRDEDVVEFHV